MLENKDYCDYETCVALREIGCRIKTEWYIHQPSFERGACYLCFGIPQETSVLDECDYIPRLSLYEAQKWLREEKKIIVIVSYYCKNQDYNSHWYWTIFINDRLRKISSTIDYSYEEALSEGIKEAVKFLKENETIHR